MNTSPPAAPTPDNFALTRRDLVRGAIGLLGVAAIPASGMAVPEKAAPRGIPSDAQTLADRAAICETQIMEVARGPGGLIISHSRFDTRLPLQEGDVPP